MTKEEILDCLENDEFDMDWNHEKGLAFREAVKNLISDSNWIPVSERLPEENGLYLVTCRIEDDNYVLEAEYEGKEWFYEYDCVLKCISQDVREWQPLPEPYEKKEAKLEEVQPGKIVNISGVDWIPLEHFANGGTLCIRKDIWSQKAFDENNSNNWKISSLREKLNTDFLMELVNQLKEHGLSTELMKIGQDLIADDGTTYGTCKDKVTLLTADQYRKYKTYAEQLKGDWYWLLTAHSTTNHCVRYVNTDGTLGYNGAYFGHGGVRPVCMFPSSIRVKE